MFSLSLHYSHSLIFFFIFMAGCAPSVLPPVETDAITAKQRWNDYTLEQLQTGYKLYTSKCGNCHYLYKPDAFSEAKWREGIDMVADKAKIDTVQKELILRYLLTVKETKSFVKMKGKY